MGESESGARVKRQRVVGFRQYGEGGRTFAEAEEDDTVASLRFSVCSTDSLQDVVSDLESARARELSLTLQNERLRSLVRQTSAERTPPISPKQNANCDVRILRVGQEKVPSKPGKLVLDVGLMTILPIKASFSVAEYVGYRVIDISAKPATEGGVWEKGRALFDSWVGSSLPAGHAGNGHNSETEDILWELLWKKSVGTGSLCRITLASKPEDFSQFEKLLREWATAPSGTDATAFSKTASSSIPLEPASTEEPEPETGVKPKDSSAASNSRPAVAAANGAPPTRVRNSFQRTMSTKVLAESTLLQSGHIEALVNYMPDRYNQHRWDLLYSAARDGISLQTLYRRVAKTSPTILFVKDMQSHVFGVFAPDPWKVHHKFYGTGETFVFRLEPDIQFYQWNQRDHSEEKRNNFFMFSTDDCIAVGGGGHFALWLDEDLLYGNSSKCQTFNNSCLASSEVFQVLNIEVWSLSEGSGRCFSSQ